MLSGSDIAIEAADMVLLESFAAIVEAVRYGRVVYDNLKKTVCTSNLPCRRGRSFQGGKLLTNHRLPPPCR